MQNGNRSLMQTRAVLPLILLAVAVRLIVVSTSLWVAQAPLADLTDLHDGHEYQSVAAALPTPAEMRSLPDTFRRFSPGYPAMIRVLSAVLPMPVAALLVVIAAAAVAVLLLQRLGVDRWTAAVFAVFTPSWLVFSSTAMAEGPFLALALWGFLEWRRNRRPTAALILGAATLVRPVGLLVFLPLWALELRGNSWRDRLRELLAFAALPVAWAVTSFAVWRDPVQQVSSYVQKDLAWPLASVVVHVLDPMRDPLKLAQVVFTLALATAAALILKRRYAATADRADLLWLLWLAAHAVFYLLLPSSWVFECLPRFFITCLPPILVGLGPYLPRRAWFLALISASSVGLSCYWTVRALAG
jgi:hypothetical protein